MDVRHGTEPHAGSPGEFGGPDPLNRRAWESGDRGLLERREDNPSSERRASERYRRGVQYRLINV